MCIAICLDPQKQFAINRFLLLGEFARRDSTVHVSQAIRTALCIRKISF